MSQVRCYIETLFGNIHKNRKTKFDKFFNNKTKYISTLPNHESIQCQV